MSVQYPRASLRIKATNPPAAPHPPSVESLSPLCHTNSPCSRSAEMSVMGISREEVQRIALLARLELTASEETEVIEHFDKMLSYVEKLNQLNTDGVEPTAHAVAVPSPLRED